MPVRKKVIWALLSFAARRKRENMWSSPSSAPSHEKTTNWGGRSPGLSRSAFNWAGCGPV